MADKKERLEKLKALESLINPPHMRAYQEQMKRLESLINPPHMRAYQEQMEWMESLINPPHMRAYQEQMERMESIINPPHMRVYKEQMERLESIINPPQMRAYQEQMERMERMISIINPPSFHAYEKQMEQIVAAAGSSTMTQMLIQSVSSYQELIAGSPLASYLVSTDEPGKPATQLVEVEGFDSLQVGDWAELEVAELSKIDQQIVEAIQSGHVEQLPEPAAQRLQFVFARIVVVWDMLMRIFNTCMAVVYLSALMSSTTVPSDIPKQAEQLSNEQRELLINYRVVNREGARLRAEATTDSQILHSLALGTLVEVIEYNEQGWYRVAVEVDGRSVQGWMYVTITTPIPKPKYPRGHFVVADVE
ncbi:SH3 domain-containing protein [Pseudomonas aeruginosa]|uniref:SH3 domain-containing protein n=1 Tax=Pseudomonas aeruginosa TaxID=287 RepID=UPI001C9DF1F7|nr:SH3 domain-containing protein [Pseudomonas aeruginosa]MBY9842154.1 SH3 domain-containing protein [Pseudomonas aeruginosa]MCV0329088.1 SH3 domain-containing protein [Pseudomonas aeruginosa]MDZ5215295.1 SH3 domain-containing protein [Pseudomonas aeruginosa]QZV17871.1 SH3 domain-containing protein [Pseudomonas aeruginosa]